MLLQTPQSYTLPDLIAICPFKWSSNPHYSRIRAESNAWVNSFNVFKDPRVRAFFTASDSERLCAYTYPFAEYEALRTAADFVNALFVPDDISDDQSGEDAKETGQTFLNIMNDKPGDGSELSRMSQEYVIFVLSYGLLRINWNIRFKERFVKIASPPPRRQFTERCTAYLNAVAQEAKHREDQVILSPEAYMTARRENSAVRTTLSMASICLGVDLPDEALEDPLFMKLHFGAVDMVCWSNVSTYFPLSELFLTSSPGSLLLRYGTSERSFRQQHFNCLNEEA